MFWKRPEYRDSKKISACQGFGEREIEYLKSGSETILYTIMVDTLYICHYTVVKTHRMYNTKS